MNKEIKELGSMIDGFKEKLSSSEYKDVMDKIMEMNKKTDLYKISYVENKLVSNKCHSKRLVQRVKEAIVVLKFPNDNIGNDISLERIKQIFHSFMFENELNIYRVISHTCGEEEYIYSMSDDDDDEVDFTFHYSENLLISIEKYDS
jgi:hypothetical protein